MNCVKPSYSPTMSPNIVLKATLLLQTPDLTKHVGELAY